MRNDVHINEVHINHIYVELPNFVNVKMYLLHVFTIYILMLHVFLSV